MGLYLKKKPIVSICISTYNRSEKIFSLVNEILIFKGDDLEIIVSDNCSTDNTIKELSKIKDKRLRIVENITNIGAIPNYIKVVSEANGLFVLYSTDKDSINFSGVPEILNFFNQNPNIITGYFALNVKKETKNIFFKQGIESLKNLGYLSRHPTGYFFKNKNLKELLLVNNYENIDKVGSFPFEFIISDLCMKGDTAIVNIPLFSIETIQEVKNIKSYSYSGVQNNLYFSPTQRIKMFQRYLDHLQSLKLQSKSDQKGMVTYLYRNCLALVTIGYRFMMQNKTICDHYSVNTEKVNLVNFIINDFNFTKEFLFDTKFDTFFTRVKISVKTHLDYLFKKTKNREK